MRRLALYGVGLFAASLLKRRARMFGPVGMVVAAGAIDAMLNWLLGPDPTPFPPRPAWLERLVDPRPLGEGS
jgi:hypothetical protein